jgi:hypothetical protein
VWARGSYPTWSCGPSTSPLDAMKCFTHQTVDAIGACKNCGKGLCANCAVDLHFALSCRGACESEVNAVRAQILRSRNLLDTQKRFRLLAPIFFWLFGAVLLGENIVGSRFSWVTFSMSVLFILFGIGIYLASRRWTRK